MQEKPKPGIYIPTLYFAEGLPNTVVTLMAQIFFKSMGADNVFIGQTSLLSWPWILKFAWSPLVDFYATKRTWLIKAQLSCALPIMGVAGVAYMSGSMPFSQMALAAVVLLLLTALVSATQDVSIDGYYLDVLNKQQQSLFVGVRNTFYRISMIFGSGAMVYLAGTLGDRYGLNTGWAAAFAVCSLLMLGLALFHRWYLPDGKPEIDDSTFVSARVDCNLSKAILSYFHQPGIRAIVFYIVIFRLGDALMLKQAPNFLLDPPSKHGLGISVADMGIVSGTVGVVALLLGGIVASWLISKDGLKRWMWPFTLVQNSAILLYFGLAKWPLAVAVHSSFFDNPFLPAVFVINSAEQFSYGLGVTAYTVFLLRTVRTEYKAAHYATATAMMALGYMLPGVASGYIYKDMGYANFFLLSFFASLPGIFAIFFLPLWRDHDGSQKS